MSQSDKSDESDDGHLESSQGAQGRRVWVKVLFVACAMLLLAEAGARLVEANSSFSDDLLPRLLNEHRANAESRELAGQDTEILFLGSSTTGAGFDPNQVPDRKAYNLWWAGAGTDALDALADEIALELFDPEVIVIGISSRELNDGRISANLSVLNDAKRALAWRRIAKNDLLTRSEILGGKSSALIRNRTDLRRPTNWVAWLGSSGETEAVVMDETGRMLRYRERTEPIISEVDEIREAQALAGFALGGPQAAGLRRLLQTLEDRRVVLVFVPTSNADYAPLHPNGVDDILAARDLAESIASQANVEFVDATDMADDRSLFGDANHLNQRGSEMLTLRVLRSIG